MSSDRLVVLRYAALARKASGMTTNADHKILICGTSLLLSAIAGHLAIVPGIDVQIVHGTAHVAGSDFVPDVILLEKDRNVPTAMPGAALTLLVQGAGRSVLLLDMERSALTVLSSQTIAVSSLSDVTARIETARRQSESIRTRDKLDSGVHSSESSKGEVHL